MSRGNWFYDLWSHSLDTLADTAPKPSKAAWVPQDTITPSPAWQPKDITAETLVPVPGQGAKL